VREHWSAKDVWNSADGVNWYEEPATPWKPRPAAGVFVFRGALWIVAGNNLESDVWKLAFPSGMVETPRLAGEE